MQNYQFIIDSNILLTPDYLQNYLLKLTSIIKHYTQNEVFH